MTILLIVLLIITAVLLILITVLQGSKKEGMASPLGSMGAYQIIGVKKTTDLLEQITWGLIISLFTVSLGYSILLKKRKLGPALSPNLERVQGVNAKDEPKQLEDKKADSVTDPAPEPAKTPSTTTP